MALGCQRRDTRVEVRMVEPVAVSVVQGFAAKVQPTHKSGLSLVSKAKRLEMRVGNLGHGYRTQLLQR